MHDGAPERFPPAQVHSPEQEEMFRARGYLRIGEAPPAPAINPLEFPKMLVHPDHVDGVPATQESIIEGNRVLIVPVPAKPEKYPHHIVNTPEEQAEWEAKGYRLPGTWDEGAYEHSLYAAGEPGDEWPKWIDGVLTEDPAKANIRPDEYPKFLSFDDGSEKIVYSAAEEARAKAVHAARGSIKHEPVKPPAESSYDAEFAEFLEFKKWKAAQLMAARAEAEEAAADERAALIAEAETRGVEVDKRWGAKKLREALDRTA